MKMVLEPGTGAVMMGTTKDGKEVALKSMSVKPWFERHAKEQAIVVLGKALAEDGTAVDSFALKASGASGKITRGTRPSKKGVIPAIDRKHPKKTKPAPAAEGEASDK